MKKWIVISALLALLLAGCGGKAAPVDPALTIDGVTFTPESAVADVLETLGEDYEYYEAISCVYDGMDKTYSYGDVTLYTYPDGETDRLMELYCTGGSVSAGDVTIGSTAEDVKAAFGSGYTEAGSVLTYALEPESEQNTPASLYFELEDGKVCAIAMTAEHRAE
ncbi:MAG TPA: hypothetical protein IAA67_05930 [Candidatus Avoscillospira stercorigallinarum]|uniref:Lipoprotein n=1 Tax=Candidatus Avoscillospira stercorigallinarum TaxID=2840708 RepID=A0A9D0Z6C1_9FIRM|nr:hypothetical protein [Candidatus Avoscillospira stercorigallinarum]